MKTGNIQNGDDLRLEAYHAALESRHHYDLLSWTVGGGAFAFVTAAFIATGVSGGLQSALLAGHAPRLVPACASPRASVGTRKLNVDMSDWR